jgi:tetratricopeptide (TPR) repeat protein
MVDVPSKDICLATDVIPIMERLLKYLPDAGKMTQLIITSRHKFELKVDGKDLVAERLDAVGLTSFESWDINKKVRELDEIAKIQDEKLREQVIEVGKGNPKLMEELNTYIKEIGIKDLNTKLSLIKDKQAEFIQELLLKEMLNAQSPEFQDFFRRISIFRLPVLQRGIELVCEGIANWQEALDKAVNLTIVEQDTTRKDYHRYWVTPLLREKVLAELDADKKKKFHIWALKYYQELIEFQAKYLPELSIELIEHALKSDNEGIAIKEAGAKLLPYLRESLAYKEAQSHGEYIHSLISKPREDEHFARFQYELGWIYHDIGEHEKAIEYYKEALGIVKEVYGEKHPNVAATLNNLGLAWDALGEHKKAIGYYEEALAIDEKIYGRRHPNVATRVNNLGLAWYALGKYKKAIGYYEEALGIVKEVYGEKHPNVASTLNNLGGAWRALGEYKKAIEYYEEALAIDEKIYGRRHPNVATDLNNLGLAWDALGEYKKAIGYYEKAYSILNEFFGPLHPHTKTVKKNLDTLFSQQTK